MGYSRRSILAIGAAVAAVAAMAVSAPVKAQKTLRAVMHSDLKILDPIWTTAYIVRNHGYMIYDTLFAQDEKGEIKPQMVDKYDVSADKLAYTLTLRDGLAWHDGQPVTPDDCVASIKRWAAKDSTGQKLMTFIAGFELLTIENAGWRPSGGERVAEIGPLPIIAGEKYSAQYMEAIFTPGMTAPAHTHSGPEAWYTLAGETCLETPQGKQIGRAGGQHVIVPGGPPMHLTATGTEQRHSLVLILHESSKPATTLVHDWAPKGLCKN